ncbi:hypothetical protein SUGI_0007990 [Cryptomeria japonica]|nr:hypothetical protein SUGI_0007990 [Cryptomeria japonica]
MYNEITSTPMPRLLVSYRDCIQLGSQIELADWFFMEEFTVLRFYGSTVKPYRLPIHVTDMVFALEYVRQLESTDRHFHGQQKKNIFPSLPFSCGGFTFERKAFNVAHDFLRVFNFGDEGLWQYDPIGVVQARLKKNGNSSALCQHESKPLLEKLRNTDSWDKVKKEMEKIVADKNISTEEISSQIMALKMHIERTTEEGQDIQNRRSYNFYLKSANPSNKSIPKSILHECKENYFTQTKINDFWNMRRNLGEPKTSAEFESIDEDAEFNKLWDMEHGGTKGDDDEHEVVVEPPPTTTIVPKILGGVSESMKENYSKGANLVEKIGFEGGGLGPRGDGIWYPLQGPPTFVSSSNPQPPGPPPHHGIPIGGESSATATGGESGDSIPIIVESSAAVIDRVGMGTTTDTSCLGVGQGQHQNISHKRPLEVDTQSHTIENPISSATDTRNQSFVASD